MATDFQSKNKNSEQIEQFEKQKCSKASACEKSLEQNLHESVNSRSRNEFNKQKHDELNPEKRRGRNTDGRKHFGECDLQDHKFFGKNKSLAVHLKNGIPEKIQNEKQSWERDAKNPQIWHVSQEGKQNRFTVKAEVLTKGEVISIKVKDASGTETLIKNELPDLPLERKQIASDSQPHMNAAEILLAARELHTAANAKLFPFGPPLPDQEKIANLLEPMRPVDRKAVELAYKNEFKVGLRQDLSKQLGSDSTNWRHVEAILNRKEDSADDAGQLRTALQKLENSSKRMEDYYNPINTVLRAIPENLIGHFDYLDKLQAGVDKSRAEADILKTLGSMKAAEIEEMKAAYKNNYDNKDIEKELFENKNLKDETKAALKILFKGIDHRDKSDCESVQNTLQLAELGLKSQNPNIFREAFQTASQDARTAFLNNHGRKKIEAAFSGDEREIALAYAERGHANIAHLIEGDTHWWHSNKEAISSLLSNPSQLDMEQFGRGKELAASKTQLEAGSKDEQALNFYTRVHKALSAAGTPREVAIWESTLCGGTEFASRVLESRDDGFFGSGWNARTDRHKMLSAVENLSKSDFDHLKTHPEEKKQIDDNLKRFLGDKDRKQVMDMLNYKLSQNHYSDATAAGRRSINELFASDHNPASRINRLLHMSKQEQARLQSNPDFAKKLKATIDRYCSGEEAYLAQRIIEKIASNKGLDGIDRVLIDNVQGSSSPLKKTINLEQSFKQDQTLLKRIGHPQNQEDQNLSQYFHKGFRKLIDQAGFGAREVNAKDSSYKSPGRYEEFARSLFSTGQMPLALRLQLARNKESKLQAILSASEKEKHDLLSTDASKRNWRESILGTGDERQLLTNLLKHPTMNNADQFRAFVVSGVGDASQLMHKLEKMTPAQKQELVDEYFASYKKLLGADLIGKLPSDLDKQHCRELLSPAEINLRQLVLNARSTADAHSSPFDAMMNAGWDKTSLTAQESNNNLDKFLKEHSSEMQSLHPDKRAKLDRAVEDYRKALKHYVESKGQASEAVVDSVITLSAVAGACFTGGSSLALLTSVGAGGAVFRVAAMKAIQGSDFDASPENIARQFAKGAVAADMGFIGPGAIGLKFAVGDKVAANAAENVINYLSEKGARSILKEIPGEAPYVIKQEAARAIKAELMNLSRQSVLAETKDTKEAIHRIAGKVLNNTVSASQRQSFEATIRGELKSALNSSMREKLINEAQSMALNVGTATTVNASTELLSTAAGMEDYKTLYERVERASAAGALGAAAFHGAAKVFHCVFRAAGGEGKFKPADSGNLQAVIGRDEKGYFATEGTLIQHANKTQISVKAGKYYFKAGDKVITDEIHYGTFSRDKIEARGLLKKGEKVADQTTKDLSALASESKGEMLGLQYRLKGEDSLTDKIVRGTESSRINDSLRYTISYPPETLAAEANKVMNQLEKRGYKKDVVKNTFKEEKVYMGINTTFEKDGFKFELQFHTPLSFHVKDAINHKPYEIRRGLVRNVTDANGETKEVFKSMEECVAIASNKEYCQYLEKNYPHLAIAAKRVRELKNLAEVEKFAVALDDQMKANSSVIIIPKNVHEVKEFQRSAHSEVAKTPNPECLKPILKS